MGRAYLLADALKDRFNVILFGFSFKRYRANGEVWQPLQDESVPIIPIRIDSSDQFYRSLNVLADRIEADIIYACKPRPTFA